MGSILKVDCEFYDEKSERRGRTKIQWLYATLASTTLLTYGLQAGWMSPMSKILQSDQSPTGSPLTDSEMSWVGSVLAATATFAVGIYAHVADAYGRKFGIIAISVPQALCWIFKIFASSPTMLIIARIFGGIASGGCFNLVPMYVKEISEDHIRGAMVSMTLLMQNFGLMAIYAMGSYMGYYTVLYVVLVIPVFTTVIMIFAPESPAYLVKRGKFEQAEATTALLRGLGVNDKIVQSEVQFMRNEEMHYSSLPRITFLNIFRNKAWRRGFILVMAIITAQAFNGCFYILTYAWSIMSASGVTGSPELQSLIVPALMIFGSLVSMICVEKLGRKNLLVATYALTAIAFVVLASAQLIQAHGGSTPGWVPVLAIAASVWAYAAGVVPMVYVIMSEMFNFQVRAKLIGCIVTYAWFTSSSQLIVATPIINAFGIYTLFFMFAGINLIGMIVALTLPETKGKTVEQIENMLDGSGKK